MDIALIPACRDQLRRVLAISGDLSKRLQTLHNELSPEPRDIYDMTKDSFELTALTNKMFTTSNKAHTILHILDQFSEEPDYTTRAQLVRAALKHTHWILHQYDELYLDSPFTDANAGEWLKTIETRINMLVYRIRCLKHDAEAPSQWVEILKACLRASRSIQIIYVYMRSYVDLEESTRENALLAYGDVCSALVDFESVSKN